VRVAASVDREQLSRPATETTRIVACKRISIGQPEVCKLSSTASVG